MSHSYSSNRVHVIFSTKERAKTISEELQPKLWAYMAGIARHHGFEAIKVGGVSETTRTPSCFCHLRSRWPRLSKQSKDVPRSGSTT